MNMGKTNGQTVILVYLLMFVVDSIKLACTLIKRFKSFVATLSSLTQVMS